MKRIISFICLISMFFTLAMPTQLIASAAVGDSIDIGNDKIVFNGLNYKIIDGEQVGPFDFDTNGNLSTFSPGGSYAIESNTVADFATRTGGDDTKDHDNVFVYAGSSRSRLYFNRAADAIEAEIAGLTFDLYLPDGPATDKTVQLFTAYVFGSNSKTSTALTKIKTGKSGLYYDGNLIFEIPAAEWINISLLFDMKNDTVTFIADDVVKSTVSTGEDMVSLGRLEGWLGRPTTGEAYIDNYGIFGYESVPYDVVSVSGVNESEEIVPTVNNVSGSKIAVKFDTAMDAETFPGNITVKDAAGTAVAITDIIAENYVPETNTLFITLAEDIVNGEEYNVALSSAVKTESGYGFDKEKAFSFLALGEITYSYGVVTKVNDTAKTITIRTEEEEEVAYSISGKTIVNGDVYEKTAMKSIVPSGALVRYMATASDVLRVIDFDDAPVIYSEVHYDEETGKFTLIEEDISELPLYCHTGEVSYENDFDGSFNEPYLSRRYKYVVEVYDYGVNIKESIALFEEYDITDISLVTNVTADYTHDIKVSFKIKENTSLLNYELYNSTSELIANEVLTYEQYNSGDDVSTFTITGLPNVTDEYTLKMWVQDLSGELVSQIYENKCNVTKVLTESEKIKFGADTVTIDGVEYVKSTSTTTVDFTENGTVNTLCASTTSYPVGSRLVADYAEYTGGEDTENHGNVFIEPYDSSDVSKRIRLANTTLYGGVYVIEYDAMYTAGTVSSSKQMWSPKLYLETGSYSWGPSLFYAKDSSYLFKNQTYATFEPGVWKKIAVAIDTDRDVCSFIVDGQLVLADQEIGYGITGVSTIEAFLYPKEDGEAFLDNITIYQYYPKYKATAKGVNESGALVSEADFHKGSEMAVTFNTAMDASKFAGNVALKNKSGEEIKILEITEANYDEATKVLKFTIDEDIEPDAEYTVVLKSTVYDELGAVVTTGVATTNGIGYDEDYSIAIKTSKPEFSISNVTMGLYSVKNLPAGKDVSAKLILKTDGAVDSKLVVALYADGKLCSIDAKEVAADEIKSAETLTISVPAAGTYGASPKYEVAAFILGDNYETLDVLTLK